MDLAVGRLIVPAHTGRGYRAESRTFDRRVPFTARPASAEARRRVGHWEMDTVLGASQAGPCVLTMVERKTGYVLLGKLGVRGQAMSIRAPRG